MDGSGRRAWEKRRSLGMGRMDLLLAALAAVGVAVFAAGIVLAVRLVLYLIGGVGPT